MDNAMAKIKRQNVNKILHRRLMIEQHIPKLNLGMNRSCSTIHSHRVSHIANSMIGHEQGKEDWVATATNRTTNRHRICDSDTP